MTTVDRRHYLILVNKKIVERDLPQFRFYWDGADAGYFRGSVQTNSYHTYELKLVLPSGSPDVMPELYVWSPTTLRKYGYGTVNSEETSHSFHTRSNGPGGRVQICHASDWDASITYVRPLCQGILWLTAYEAHLATGEDICDYFA